MLSLHYSEAHDFISPENKKRKKIQSERNQKWSNRGQQANEWIELKRNEREKKKLHVNRRFTIVVWSTHKKNVVRKLR